MKIVDGAVAAVFLLITPVADAAAEEASAKRPRAVIELFTSQGCANCPPADAYLKDLGHDPSLVTLSFAVDYWDYLGWKDTLADRAFTARQRAYSEGRGDRHVYTPQAVVDEIGRAHV